jgi:adhesin transport system membrane fusion protein
MSDLQKQTEDPEDRKTTAKRRSFRRKPSSNEIFRRMPSEEVDLSTDIRVSLLAQTPRGGSAILWGILIFTCCALTWAYFAEIDEVTRGDGKVVPSRQLQVVQNLEGGILAEVLVNAGNIVEKDQLLLRIDDKRFSAPFQESRFSFLALKAKVARLQAETYNTPFELPDEVSKELPEVGLREKGLYESRQQELSMSLGVLDEQRRQREQEIAELEGKIAELTRTHKLLKSELEFTRPLVKGGAVSEVEFLRLQRQDSEMLGQITAAQLALPRAKSKLEESKRGIIETKLKFTNTAKAELNEAFTKLESLSANAITLADRLDRTSVRSPVRGIINQVFVNTVGGVIQPGMNLVEIVPLEDTLLIQARIKPSDIAFLSPNLKATVKFTAYDFTIYGGLDAKVEHISADSIIDDKGNSYFLVTVRTDKNYLGTEHAPLPIIPGMVASIDILTGKKRILTYLLKPILRAKSQALRER